MAYAYSQNGIAFKEVPEDYQPFEGEIVVQNILNYLELKEIFPNYELALKKLNIQNEISNITAKIKLRDEVFNDPSWANLEQERAKKIQELNNL
jgi:hypothetical protein